MRLTKPQLSNVIAMMQTAELCASDSGSRVVMPPPPPSPPPSHQSEWLLEMPESEEALQRQAKKHGIGSPSSSSSSNTRNMLHKCGAQMDAVAQWFLRYGGRGHRISTSTWRWDQLALFLAVVSTFEAFLILYLLTMYESCM